MSWQGIRRETIIDFLIYLNTCTDKYVLKGGTALFVCYGLDRFSEDIDLDGYNSNEILLIIEKFCRRMEYKYRIAKNTDTVKRVFIDYGGKNERGDKPLKIEVSYRVKDFNALGVTVINNILVYNLESLLAMKLMAYGNRDKIRDLYDITFIGLKYLNSLPSISVQMMQNALAYKGIQQFDYLMHTQTDELIDNDVLAVNFLMLWEKLGLG